MRKVLILGLAAGAVCLGWADAQACGDKFLVVGRGVKFQRAHKAVHPASILIYMNPGSRLPTVAKKIKLESNLKQAGHKVQTIEDPTRLDDALKSAQYDLVLADVADSPSLEKHVSARTSKPVVMPVLYQPTADELAAAQKQYGCAMKTSAKDYLAAIDTAIAQKLKRASVR
jgi:hypothetical protein